MGVGEGTERGTRIVALRLAEEIEAAIELGTERRTVGGSGVFRQLVARQRAQGAWRRCELPRSALIRRHGELTRRILRGRGDLAYATGLVRRDQRDAALGRR